jgi:hypothetical protein
MQGQERRNAITPTSRQWGEIIFLRKDYVQTIFPMPHPNYQSTMKEQNPFTPREKNNSRNETNLRVNIGITNGSNHAHMTP